MAINRDAILRIVMAIHFVFTSFVLMVPWLPKSYELSQVTILLLGVWAIIHRNAVIQVELLMVITAFSFVLDIIAIGMYFAAGLIALGSYFIFSVFFAILLLLLKPAMLLLFNKVREERLGTETSPTFGQWGLGAGHVPGYQPVDGQTVVPNV